MSVFLNLVIFIDKGAIDYKYISFAEGPLFYDITFLSKLNQFLYVIYSRMYQYDVLYDISNPFSVS